MNSKSSAENVENGEATCGEPVIHGDASKPGNSVNLLMVQETDYCCDSKSTPTKKSKSTENLISPRATSKNSLKQVGHNIKTNATGSDNCSRKSTKVISSSQKKTKTDFRPPKEIATDVSIKVVGSSDLDEEQEGCARFLGILLAVIAAIMFSMSALIIKVLGYHPFNLGVWRFGVMALIPIPFLIHAAAFGKDTFVNEIWPERSIKSGLLLMIQAILGANSILFTFYGLKYLNIADCIVIGTSAPVFVTLFAFVFLGERCGLFPVLTALLALVGVTIISKPPILTGEESLNEETMLGVTSSFSSMILLTVCYIVIRYLRKVHHALVNLCFGIWGFLQSLLMAIFMDKLQVPHSYHEAGLIILSAALAFSAQTCITLALKYEHAGPVALVRTTEVVFAFGWQAIFLGVKPDLFSVIGAIVTLSGVVLTSFRKMVMSLPEDDETRRRFRFLLL